MVLRRKQELLQSKLRIASMANPSDPPNILDGSGSSSDAQVGIRTPSPVVPKFLDQFSQL